MGARGGGGIAGACTGDAGERREITLGDISAPGERASERERNVVGASRRTPGVTEALFRLRRRGNKKTPKGAETLVASLTRS